jgi:hypothetical protein
LSQEFVVFGAYNLVSIVECDFVPLQHTVVVESYYLSLDGFALVVHAQNRITGSELLNLLLLFVGRNQDYVSVKAEGVDPVALHDPNCHAPKRLPSDKRRFLGHLGLIRGCELVDGQQQRLALDLHNVHVRQMGLGGRVPENAGLRDSQRDVLLEDFGTHPLDLLGDFTDRAIEVPLPSP